MGFKKYNIKTDSLQGYIGKQKIITLRSSWELKTVKYLENLYKTRRIKGWTSEESVFQYYSLYDKKEHRYFMDFTVKLPNDDVTFIEVKPYKEHSIPPKKGKNEKTYQYAVKNWITNQSKWKAVKEWCLNENVKSNKKYSFVIWDEYTLGIK